MSKKMTFRRVQLAACAAALLALSACGVESAEHVNNRSPERERFDDFRDEISFGFNTTGTKWSSPNISFSYAPDGTIWDGGTSSRLFASLDSMTDRATWQREYARALQSWAEYANINFHEVRDDGSMQDNAMGLIQADGRFGDIRVGTKVLGSNVLAETHFPTSSTGYGYTTNGDMAFSQDRTYVMGGTADWRANVLHESGHALGLMHSTSGTVMYGYATGLLTLTSDDIAGIQSLYGARRPDVYDAAASNDSRAAATALTLAPDMTAQASLDLTNRSDIDYFKLVAPSGASGRLTVSANAKLLSLLAPKVMLYDGAGTLMTQVSADYGQTATAYVDGVAPGKSYYAAVDGATADVFGVGAYKLFVSFAGPATAPDTTPPTVSLTGTEDGFGYLNIRATASDNVGVTMIGIWKGSTMVWACAASACSRTEAASTATYTAKAYDAVGNVATATYSSSSSTPAGDSTAPTVAITSPANGAYVAGTIAIQANATDNVGVVRVDFSVDGTLIGSDAAAPFSMSWSSAVVANGSHVLNAKAYDAANNEASSQVTVSVSNTQPDTTPPSVAITSPANGASVAGTIVIQADAADNVGIARVDFSVDGAFIGSDNAAPFGVSWASPAVADGSHVLTATAYDAANNAASSQVSVTVANARFPGDTSAPTAPTNLTATKSGNGKKISVKLSWGASTDNVGVTGYNVYRNGVRIGTVTGTSYTHNRPPKDETSTYQVKAIDAAGNESAGSNEVSLSL